MKFKIATIGCGFIAHSSHGPAHKKYKTENSNITLAACCDTNIEEAKKFAHKFGYEKTYTDYIQMLNEVQPDVVCLFVPPHLTAQFSCTILKLKYPLLIEKPPGVNRKEAEQIKVAAKENNTSFMVAFNRRFMPIMQNALAYVKESKIDISVIDYQMVRNNRTDDDFSTTAIHGIDLVKFIANAEYTNISYDIQKVPIKDKDATNIFMQSPMKNGIFAKLSFVNSAGTIIERVTLHGKDHTIFVNLPIWNGYDAPGEIIHIKNGSIVEIIAGEESDMYISNGFYNENKTFFDSLRNNKPLEPNIDSCLQPIDIEHTISKMIKEKFSH